jgi:hypothetical protein
MKTFLIVCSSFLFVSANVISHRFDAACNNVNPSPAYSDCYVDLTIAMDMSSAMGNTANIATMTNSILSDFLPNFSFYDTFTAGLSFGSTVTSSMYWDNYADMCNFIHSAEETATQVGLNFTSLSEVFQNYQIDLQNSGRNYQKVLVLLTAKSDPTEIAAAKVYADQITASGVAIIVVALNQDNTSPLSQLGQYFYNSSGYTIPITAIPGVICSYGGQTMLPPTINPSGPPYDPLSDAIGTSCSNNTENLWIDIIFLVDVSNAMTTDEITAWATGTDSYTSDLPFGLRGPHKTRIGIITFATNSVTRLALKDGVNADVFEEALFKIVNYVQTDDNGGYVKRSLKAAEKMFNDTMTFDGNPKDIRKQVIILVAAAYDETGSQNAVETAQTLKDDGIFIFTISYKSSEGVYPPGLDKLASPGYAYYSEDMNLPILLPLGLTQANCFCPVGSLQFVYFNGHNNTNYADCISFHNIASRPSTANKHGCINGGSVISITSQKKLDFLTDHVLANLTTSKIKKFIAGAHKKYDGNWYWWGYNQTEYPVGHFPVFNPASTDTYSYMFNYFGFNWSLNGTDDKNVFLPYMCQTRACDADYICEQK